MYYSRSIDSRLLEWKQSANHKPLLLRGARQVGKSSAVRHIALSFEHYIEVNFEKQPELKNLFSNLHDVKHLATAYIHYSTLRHIQSILLSSLRHTISAHQQAGLSMC